MRYEDLPCWLVRSNLSHLYTKQRGFIMNADIALEKERVGSFFTPQLICLVNDNRICAAAILGSSVFSSHSLMYYRNVS